MFDPTGGSLGTDSITEAADLDSDTLDFSAFTSAITFNLGSTSSQSVGGALTLALTTATGVESIIGGSGNDSLTGNDRPNRLEGRDGNDFLGGGNGDDTLVGGSGNDTLSGYDGDDTYVFAGTESLGTDTISEYFLLSGDDTLDFSGLDFGAGISVDLGFYNSQEVVNYLGKSLSLVIPSAFPIENVIGTAYDDTLVGNSQANHLEGGAGDDLLIGEAGNDSLIGGIGDDTYVFDPTGGSLGNDSITETADLDSDTLDFSAFTSGITFDLASTSAQSEGGSLTLTLSSATGVENIIGGSSVDTLTGNSRPNRLEGMGGNDTLHGMNGNDILIGGSGNDIVYGEGGDDTFYVGSGGEALVGGFGSDTYIFEPDVGDANSDTIIESANADTDTLDFSLFTGAYAANMTLNLTQTSSQVVIPGKARIALLVESAFENVIAGAGNDTITGNSRNNVIYGGDGDDTIYGGAGSDQLFGGDGNDILTGGGGDDTLVGGAGSDTYRFLPGPQGSDVVDEDADQDSDTLDFQALLASLTIDLGLTTLQQDVVIGALNLRLTTETGLENVIGGSGSDSITGNSRNNRLEGRLGSDTLDGAGGNDYLDGGADNDTLDGSAGDDWLSIDAPVLSALSTQILSEGTLTVVVEAIYLEGIIEDVVFAPALNNPGGVSITPLQPILGKARATLQWEPPVNTPPGLYSINIDLWDVDDPDLRTRAVVQVLFGTANEPPQLAEVDNLTAIVGERLSIQLTAEDEDGSSLGLRYSLGVNAPTGVHLNPITGLLSWEPIVGDVGQHTFDVLVHDDGRPSLSDTQAIIINVLPANIVPTITAPTSVALTEDTPFVFGSIGTAIEVSDADSSANSHLQLAIVVTHGKFVLGSTSGLIFDVGDSNNQPSSLVKIRGTAVQLNAALNGLTFEPDPNFYGRAELRLELSDLGNGGTHRPATKMEVVSLVVGQVIDVPSIENQTLHVLHGGSIGNYKEVGTVVAFNPDPNQFLLYEITEDTTGTFAIDAATGGISVADFGLLTAGNSYTVTVRVSYETAAPLDPSEYDQALVTIRVESTNAIAMDNNYAVDEDSSVLGNVVTNDATYTTGSPPVIAAYYQGIPLVLGVANVLSSGATLTLHADGSFTYDASTSAQFRAGYTGTTLYADSFSYVIADALGKTDTATATFSINHVNDLHVVVSDQPNQIHQTFALPPDASTNHVIGKLLVAHAEPSESLTYNIISDPSNLFEIDAYGTLKYTVATPPTPPQYTLEIEVTDSLSRDVTVNVTIDVLANSAPVAPVQNYETPEDVPLLGNVLSDDTGSGSAKDAPGQTFQIVAVRGKALEVGVPIQLASGAVVVVNSDGSFEYDPSPSPMFNRLGLGQSSTDAVQLTVRDQYGAESQTSLIVKILGRNDAPLAYGNHYEVLSSNTVTGNVVSDLGPAGIDSDVEGSNKLYVLSVDGNTVGNQTVEIFTQNDATLVIRKDGSFEYDPSTIPGLDALPENSRFYDAFVYTISDEFGASATAIARITVVVGPHIEETEIEVIDFGLVNDTGAFNNDRRTDDPTLQGTISEYVDAHHVVVEFDLTVASFSDSLGTDAWTPDLSSSSSGYPDFVFDPTISSSFPSEAGEKIIAYRVVAYDDSSPTPQILAQSPWKFFDFVLDLPNQGTPRLEEDFRLYHDTGDVTNLDSPDTVNTGALEDNFTADPRLYGVIAGDFQGQTVRVEFEHARLIDGVWQTFVGHVDLTEPGPVVYDPRSVDVGLASVSYQSMYVAYRVGVLETGGTLEEPLIAEGWVSFTYSNSLPPPQVYLDLVAVTDTSGTSLGAARTLSGTVFPQPLATLDPETSFVIEFDYADESGNFDPNIIIDGETTAVKDTTSSSNNNFVFQYTAVGLLGLTPKLRARVRQWNSEHGDYATGQWEVLTFSAQTAPAIASMSSVGVQAGDGALPKITGYLEGAASGEAEQHDLAKVSYVTIEFFHNNGNPGPTDIPDGTTVTDAQGHFEYVPRGVSSNINVCARTVVTIPGTSTRITGAVHYASISIAPPTLPTILSTSLVGNPSGGVTDNPQVVGSLVQNTATGIAVGSAFIEFAHDDLSVFGDEEEIVGYAQPDAQGNFTYLPLGLVPDNQYYIRARVAYYDPVLQDTFEGNAWTYLYVQVDAPANDPATIDDLHLVNFTLDDEEDLLTSDPTVAGRVEDPEGYVAFVTVEFRDHATQTSLGSTVTDAQGNFVHQLTNLTIGSHSIDVQIQEWDYWAADPEDQLVLGDWIETDLQFTYAYAPGSEVSDFRLHSDTGSEQDDDETSNPLVWGQVTAGDVPQANVTVAIDVDDHAIDATVVTDSEGRFAYLPAALSIGGHTIRARVATWEAASNDYTYTTGVSFTFELLPPTNDAAEVSEFVLASPPPSGYPVTDATVIGTIINDGPVDGITIELDYDSNDNNGINHSTTTDVYGRFQLAIDPPVGQTTIRARAVEITDTNTQFGNWMTLEFNYQPQVNDPPAFDSLYVNNAVAGSPPTTNSPGVWGYVDDDWPYTGFTVEFSLTEAFSAIGATEVGSNGGFSFMLTNLTPGETYTVWARVKEPIDGSSPQFSEPESVTFIYVPDSPTGLRLSEFELLNDTATSGGSTSIDGSTSDSHVVGTVAGTEDLENLLIQFDLDGDGYPDNSVETNFNGQFEHNLALTAAGYYHVQARVFLGVGNYSNWQTLNFVFDTDDSSPEALALVQAFATINPKWQTAANFDSEFASSAAETLYEAALTNAGLDYDFKVAAANLARQSAQQGADSSYEQARLAAEAAYQAALVNAQSAFVTALAALPAADRATYSLKDFVWPTAPADNALVVPSDGQQPRPPQAPTYDGQTYDYTNDPAYRSAVALAEQQYFEDVQDARDAYQDAVEPIEDAYREDVDIAYETYEDAVDGAYEDYDTAHANDPQFDHEEYQQVLDQIREAWADYIEEVRQNNQRYTDVTSNALQRKNADLAKAAQEEQEEINAAYGDGYEDNYEYSAYLHEVYEIDKKYGPIYEKILNEYDKTVENAERDRDVGNAQALHDALGTVYPLQSQLSNMARDFSHVKLTDWLADEQSLVDALANARKQLETGLAAARQTRDKALADKAYLRDAGVEGVGGAVVDGIAKAQQNRDLVIADAKRDAIVGWATYLNSSSSAAPAAKAWAAYQANLAENEYTYQAAVVDLTLTRDQAKYSAAKTFADGQADAEHGRSLSRATAEYTRNVELGAAATELRTDADLEYTERHHELVGAWQDRRTTINDAALTLNTAKAEIDAKYDIAQAEAYNALITTMPYTGYGWAYDVNEWNGEEWVLDIDNEPTREQAERTYQQRTAEITRDRIIDTQDADEVFDAERIDATTLYRQASTDAYHDAAQDVSGLYYTYEIRVATAQDLYNMTLVTAEGTYAVTIALAEAKRTSAEIAADATFDLAEAPLGGTRSVDDAGDKKTYEVDEAQRQIDELTSWSTGGDDARWEAYQVALAQAEETRVTNLGTAAITRATQLAGINLTWTQTVVAADLAYAATIYGDPGDPEDGGAYADRAQEIADAHVAIATGSGGDGPLLTYMIAQAGAIKTHDLGVADENQAFYHALATADADRDHEVSKAQHEYTRDEARNTYAFSVPDGISQEERARLGAEADDRRDVRVARANETRANEVAEARRDWTYAIGDLNVAFVVQQVAVQVARAAALQSEIIVLATAVGEAQRDYEIADAQALRIQTVTIAQADKVYELAAAGFEATYAAGVTSALNAKSIADVAALGVYEVGLYTDHLNSYPATPGTPLLAFQKLAAGADKAWAEARATARNTYFVQLAGYETLRTAAINLADVAAATTGANANLTFATGQAATDAALSVELATADADLYIGQKTAEAELLVGSADGQGDADVAFAEAVRDRDNATADAMVEWVATVAAAQVEYETGAIDWDERTEIIRQADEKRRLAEMAAAKAFHEAIHEAGVQMRLDVGQARIDFVTASNDAKLAHVEVVNAALEQAVRDSAGHDNTLTGKLAGADEVHQRSLLAADYDHTVRVGNQDVQFATEMASAGNTRAGSRAVAEAGYQLALAEQERDDWQALAASSPGNEELQFQAAQAAAFAAWIGLMSPSYVAYATGLAQADGQQNVNLAIADAVQDAAEALAALGYGNERAAQERTRTVGLAVVTNDSGLAAVQNENRLALAVTQANAAQASAYVEAQVGYDAAIEAIDHHFLGDYYYSQYYYNGYWSNYNDYYDYYGGDFQSYYFDFDQSNSDEAQAARREAVYQRDVAFAEADYDWRSRGGQAEYDFAASETGREYQLLVREAAIERDYAYAGAASQATHDVKLAAAEQQHMIDVTAAENIARGASANANVVYLSASYDHQVTALDELVEGLDELPWAQFEVDRAAAEADAWEAVKSDYLQWQAEVSAAYSTYTQQRADAYYDAAVQIAGAVRGYQETSADETRDHVGRLAAVQRNFALSLADLAALYRSEVATAEYEYKVALAEDVLNQTTSSPSPSSERTDALNAAEEAYQENYVALDQTRRQDFAESGFELARDLKSGYQTQAAVIADAQEDFDQAAAHAYYNTSGGGPAGGTGLENKLAVWASYYDELYAYTFADELEQLADATNTPWANLAMTERSAHYNEFVAPLSLEIRNNRKALAAADNAYNLALGTAGRAQWQAQVGADASRALLLAAQLLGTTTASGDPSLVPSPQPLAPPLPDTGSVTIVGGNDYWVIQPGAVHPGWYYDHIVGWWEYIVGGNSYDYFDWMHGGEPWSSGDYYWDDWGAWGEGWIGWGQSGPYGYQSTWDYREFVAPYAGYTQDPFQFYYASGWYDAQLPIHHGGWDYNPSAPGWGGWNPWTPYNQAGWSANYLPAPFPGGGNGSAAPIDVQGDLAEMRDAIAELTADTENVRSVLVTTEDQSPPTINPGRGTITNSLGTAYLVAPNEGNPGGGDPIDTTPVSLDEWADRLAIASAGQGFTAPGSGGPLNVADDVLTKIRLGTASPPKDTSHLFTGLGNALGTAAGEFVNGVVNHVGLLTDAYHAAMQAGPVIELTGKAQQVWDAMRLNVAKEMGLKWQAYNDLLLEYEARVERDRKIYDDIDLFAITQSRELIEAEKVLEKDKAIVAILKLAIQELETQYSSLGLDSIRFEQFNSAGTKSGGTGIAAVGAAALVEGSTVRGMERTGIEFEVAQYLAVVPAVAKGVGKLGLRAAVATLTRAGVKTSAREAVELAIINKEFVPIAERLLQNLTNRVNRELADDISKAAEVLTPAEMIAAAGSRRIAITNYGKAVERLVRDEIKDDPILKTLFEYVGDKNGPVDFLAKGIFERPGVKPIGFDITTPGQVLKHLKRSFDGELHVITYQRPAGFP